MWWAYSTPLVAIELTNLPKSGRGDIPPLGSDGPVRIYVWVAARCRHQISKLIVYRIFSHTLNDVGKLSSCSSTFCIILHHLVFKVDSIILGASIACHMVQIFVQLVWPIMERKKESSNNSNLKTIIGSEFCTLNILEQSNVNSKHMLCLDFCFRLILRQCTVLFTPEIFFKKT